MKVLLVDAKFERWGFSAPFSVAAYGLICVASYLKSKGIDVEILDMNAGERGIEWDELPSIIREKKPKIIGVPSSMSCYVPNSLRVVKIAKAVDPSIITVGGGINFTVNSEWIMEQNPELDFIVRGDGEHTMEELVRAIESGERDFSKISGLTWRAPDGTVVRNPDRLPIMDLDSLPLPDWSLVDLNWYGVNTFPPSWGKQVLLTLSRGCPYHCQFCLPRLASYNTYREHGTKRKLEIISELYHKYERRMFWINDLIFGVNEERTREFLEGLINEGLRINMCVDMRVDLLLRREHLLPLMREAGVRIVALGIESPLPKDNEAYNKYPSGMDPREAAVEAVRLLREHGINSWAFYMIGALHHTPEDIGEIWRFADKVDADLTIFALTTPLPGTPYYEQVKDHIVIHDLGAYDENTPVFRYPYMTDDQIRMLYPEAWICYYMKPSRVVRKWLFGDEYTKWFYGFMRTHAGNWGEDVRRTWQRYGWRGYQTDERKLRSWARRTLGLKAPERAFMNFLMWLDQALRAINFLPNPMREWRRVMGDRARIIEEKFSGIYTEMRARRLTRKPG